jgi:hypothetical protein
MSTEDPDKKPEPTKSQPQEVNADHTPSATIDERRPREIGGRDGPDPTRYGDWEKNGRCIDF